MSRTQRNRQTQNWKKIAIDHCQKKWLHTVIFLESERNRNTIERNNQTKESGFPTFTLNKVLKPLLKATAIQRTLIVN